MLWCINSLSHDLMPMVAMLGAFNTSATGLEEWEIKLYHIWRDEPPLFCINNYIFAPIRNEHQILEDWIFDSVSRTSEKPPQICRCCSWVLRELDLIFTWFRQTQEQIRNPGRKVWPVATAELVQMSISREQLVLARATCSFTIKKEN